MNVNPADTTALQFAMAKEFHDLEVGDGSRLMYTTIRRQEFLPTSDVAYEKFSRNQLMPCNLTGI